MGFSTPQLLPKGSQASLQLDLTGVQGLESSLVLR